MEKPPLQNGGAESEEFGTFEDDGKARCACKAGISAVAESGRKGVASRTGANINLVVPRAILPTLRDHAGDGKLGTFTPSYRVTTSLSPQFFKRSTPDGDVGSACINAN